jgi:hypothetical protein
MVNGELLTGRQRLMAMRHRSPGGEAASSLSTSHLATPELDITPDCSEHYTPDACRLLTRTGYSITARALVQLCL